MKIIAVAGTGSGCGKTTVACRILRAFPGLGAVKISPREEPGRVEWGSGSPGKDTDLYAKNGAVRVARIIGRRDTVGATWNLVKGQFKGCNGVVIEGTSALAIPEERYVIFVVGKTRDPGREDRNRAIESNSDVIIDSTSHFNDSLLFESIRSFLTCSRNSLFESCSQLRGGGGAEGRSPSAERSECPLGGHKHDGGSQRQDPTA